jgi:hypothetical protein
LVAIAIEPVSHSGHLIREPAASDRHRDGLHWTSREANLLPAISATVSKKPLHCKRPMPPCRAVAAGGPVEEGEVLLRTGLMGDQRSRFRAGCDVPVSRSAGAASEPAATSTAGPPKRNAQHSDRGTKSTHRAGLAQRGEASIWAYIFYFRDQVTEGDSTSDAFLFISHVQDPDAAPEPHLFA